jgi:hypothetical protein
MPIGEAAPRNIDDHAASAETASDTRLNVRAGARTQDRWPEEHMQRPATRSNTLGALV